MAISTTTAEKLRRNRWKERPFASPPRVRGGEQVCTGNQEEAMRSEFRTTDGDLKPTGDSRAVVRVEDGLRGGVVALGNFDGFHLGHQAVVGRALARARVEGRPALVVTFDPHPVRHFKPEVAPFLLTSIAQRARLFGAFGADYTLALPFDQALAKLSPEDFVTKWLHDYLGAAAVVTGSDFCFGCGRDGDTEALKTIGARYGIDAEAVDVVRTNSGVVSSTRIRQHLAAGEIDAATLLLDRPHRIEGVVRCGISDGRIAAYIALDDCLRPRSGSYEVRGYLADGRTLAGTVHLGDGAAADPAGELLELHFTEPGDLVGQRIMVELIAFLGSGAMPASLRSSDEPRRDAFSLIATRL